MKIKKAIWLSIDLGIKADYHGLYKWLDNHDAVECGNGLAYLKYSFISHDNTFHDELFPQLIDDIGASVNFSSSDRVYCIWKDEAKRVRGLFIIGTRRQSPWEGYGNIKGRVNDDTE